MKTRYKILIISIMIIAILLFLRAPLITGQPECNDEITSIDYDCKLWSDWDWIYYSVFERGIIGVKYPSQCVGCQDNKSDVKLDAQYKLYPDVSWIHPNDLGNQQLVQGTI